MSTDLSREGGKVIGKLLAERYRERGEEPPVRVVRNERLSKRVQRRAPLPPTRGEADTLFRPNSSIFDRDCLGARLTRLNRLGLLELRPQAGTPITNGEAHLRLLDHYWPES